MGRAHHVRERVPDPHQSLQSRDNACRANCDQLCTFADCADPTLEAGLTPNVMRRNSHLGVVTGHVQCQAGLGFDVHVTLTQRFGAVAFGSTHGDCAGDEAKQWCQDGGLVGSEGQ
jgi:hypothetical protein